MKQIVGKTRAWLTSGADMRSLDGPDAASLVSNLGYSSSDMSEYGWTEVGNADIVLTIPDATVLLRNQIESLRKQQRDALAKAEGIEQQIKNLLAISYEPQK